MTLGEEMVKATGKRGGQRGNQNAIQHGAYLTKFDGRTRLGKLRSEIESALVSALGDQPSPQEILLLQRASVKAIRCATIETQLLKSQPVCPSLEIRYLQWSRELREDLKTLGIKRVARPVISLDSYLEGRYGG